jgi:hypothetical protein
MYISNRTAPFCFHSLPLLCPALAKYFEKRTMTDRLNVSGCRYLMGLRIFFSSRKKE